MTQGAEGEVIGQRARPFRMRPAIIGQMFRPPARFDPPLEGAFSAESDRRSAHPRQTALVLLLLIWISYFGWDSFHGYRNEEFRSALDEILALRLAGTVCIFVTGASLMLWRESRRTICAALCFCIGALYLLSLGMIAVTPFPYNYLFYYICLPMILMFLFGAFRLESRLVYVIVGACIVASFVFLVFTETTEATPKNLLQFLSKSLSYYNVAALGFLLTFSVIGCAVAVELERAARAAFVRERELSDRNARLAASERDTRIKTAALVKAKDELRALAERQNVNKSRFLADAAHDLRQPMQALTNLLGAARHALESGDGTKCDSLLALAQDASRLTRASFNAVLDISRLESGFVQAEYSAFDLSALVEEVAAPFRLAAAERGIELRIRPSRAPALVHSDPHLLARVIGNLISNAIKYGDPGKASPAVIVGIVALPSRIRLDVVDNGVGIAEADWARVFDPFTQLHNAERDREKGVGLGLSIVSAIIALLKEHRLDMRSRAGEGTRFSLELPLGDDARGATLIAETTRPPGPVDLSGLYAFYVEDDALVRASTLALFDVLGLRYEAFASLAELETALDEIEREPDLLITDFRLPDGRSAEDVVRAVSGAFDMSPRLIVLTGEVQTIVEDHWIGNGKVLRKPVSPETLVKTISALCLEPAQVPALRAEPISEPEPGSCAATPRSAAPSAGPP